MSVIVVGVFCMNLDVGVRADVVHGEGGPELGVENGHVHDDVSDTICVRHSFNRLVPDGQTIVGKLQNEKKNC